MGLWSHWLRTRPARIAPACWTTIAAPAESVWILMAVSVCGRGRGGGGGTLVITVFVLPQRANAFTCLDDSVICASGMRIVLPAAPVCWCPKRAAGAARRRRHCRRCRMCSACGPSSRWAVSAAAAATARWSSESVLTYLWDLYSSHFSSFPAACAASSSVCIIAPPPSWPAVTSATPLTAWTWPRR